MTIDEQDFPRATQMLVCGVAPPTRSGAAFVILVALGTLAGCAMRHVAATDRTSPTQVARAWVTDLAAGRFAAACHLDVGPHRPACAREWRSIVAVIGSAKLRNASTGPARLTSDRGSARKAAVVVQLRGFQVTVMKKGGRYSVDERPTPPTNRTVADLRARRVLETIPRPRAARPLAAAPTAYLRHLHVDDEPMDPRLTQRGWWSVPLSYRALLRWYAAQPPAKSVRGATDTGSPQRMGVLDWPVPPGSPAYATPYASVSYQAAGARRTDIEVAVTIAARYDPTARTRVPATGVTRVVVRRVAIDGHPRHRLTTSSTTDPSLIRAAVRAFDALPSAYEGVAGVACASPAGNAIAYTYGVSFRWPGHVLVAHPGTPLCLRGMRLVRDGRVLKPTLQPTPRLDRTLSAVVHATGSTASQ